MAFEALLLETYPPMIIIPSEDLPPLLIMKCLPCSILCLEVYFRDINITSPERDALKDARSCLKDEIMKSD